jgi:hypothetical protein
VMWWYGLELAQLPNLASDDVVILVVCISIPVQVLLLALMARRASADPAEYSLSFPQWPMQEIRREARRSSRALIFRHPPRA